jgi:hypothetical protein
MNFNRSDSLKFSEVLSDPKFVEFLQKWELMRRPSAVRAIFTHQSSLEFFLYFLSFNFLIYFIVFFVFFSPPLLLPIAQC